MKMFVKRAMKDEEGAGVLALVLVLLVVGGLVLTPLLGLMSTGLMAGQVYEKKTNELYAADAGVEYAVWQIQNATEVKRPSCATDPTSWNFTIASVNNKSVEISVEYVEDWTFKITSIAITADGSNTAAIDSTTTVEAYVCAVSGNYSSITDHILISQREIEWGNKVVLNYTGEHGPYQYYTDPWPTQKELSDWYWLDVINETAYDSDTIDLAGNNTELGPLYRNGGLTIKNSDNGNVPTLTLNGTLYITGDTSIGYGTSQNFEMALDLNGNTIFVGSNTSKYALQIGDNCNIKGPGVLVAFGGIYFKPKGQVTTDPVFILSLSGATLLQPSGSFYGAIGGSLEVDVQTGNKPTIVYPEAGFGDINFPGCTQPKPVYYGIASWEINPR